MIFIRILKEICWIHRPILGGRRGIVAKRVVRGMSHSFAIFPMIVIVN